jgi:pimeloyl-ACP methyl ester carboxylesterase
VQNLQHVLPVCNRSLISICGLSGKDLAVEWKKVDVPVLVTWGTLDPTTSAEENRYLAEMINSFHPGRATYAEFPGMGHGLDLWPSQREWLESFRKKQHTEFDAEFLKRVEEWIKAQIRSQY